jgi:hypothetical protein
MTTYSNAAKALAVLTFTAGVNTDEKAIELFDLITQAETDEQFEALFEEHDFSVWDPVEGMTFADWFAEIDNLAMNFDRLATKFPPAAAERSTQMSVSEKYGLSGISCRNHEKGLYS